MKKFTSTTLKTLVALLLAVIMVIGSTTSTLAVVIDDLAATGWAATTYVCGPWNSWNASDISVSTNWSTGTRTINFANYGCKIGDTIRFNYVNAGNWLKPKDNDYSFNGVSDFYYANEGTDNKAFTFTLDTSTCVTFAVNIGSDYGSCGVKCYAATQTAPYNDGDYYIYNNITNTWYNNGDSPKMLAAQEKDILGGTSTDNVRYYDFYGDKDANFASGTGWSASNDGEIRFKFYSAGNTGTIAPTTATSQVTTSYNSSMSMQGADATYYYYSKPYSSMSSSAYNKMRIVLNLTDGTTKYVLSTVPKMNPTFSTTSFNYQNTYDLTTMVSLTTNSGVKGDNTQISLSNYQYSTNGTAWTDIGTPSAWTPNSTSIRYLRVTATDAGVDNTANSATRNVNFARSETKQTPITVNEYPYISSLTSSPANIAVGKTSTITTSLQYCSSPTVTYTVWTNSACTTAATSGTDYTLTTYSQSNSSNVQTFTGLKSGTYYIKASVTSGGNTYSRTTSVSVGVYTPSVSRSNMSSLKVNSETAISPSVTSSTTPQYYYFQYSLTNNPANFTTDDITSNQYFDIKNGKIVAKKPTTSAQTVYYRIIAGTDENNITYTGTANSFTVSIATPSCAVSSASYLLLEDTGSKATVSNLATYGLTAKDVTWSVTSGTSLQVNASTGALNPLTTGATTIQAAIKFNDSYTRNVTKSVTVQAATLTVDKTEISAVYGSENLAIDYTNASKATFTVTTNAKDTAYKALTTVTVEKANSSAPFTLNKTTLTANSTTVTVTSTGVTSEPQKVYVKYFIGETELTDLRKTIYVTINPYEEWLTIYFEDTGYDYTNVYAYTWVTGSTGTFIKPYGSATVQPMVKIGTQGTTGNPRRVYAQKYYKKDVVGAKDSSKRNILFSANNDKNNFGKQTVDITPTGDCFENYTYFRWSGSYTDTKLNITQLNFGCLKPTSATVTVSATAMAATQASDIDFTIDVAGYHKASSIGSVDGGNIQGYYKLTNALTSNTYFDFSSTTNPNTLNTTSTAEITATAKSGVTGSYTIAGKLYFSSSATNSPLKNPITDGTADEFIATDIKYGNDNSVDISVADIKSNIHLLPVQLSGGSYTSLSGTNMDSSGTLSSSASTGERYDLGTNVTINTRNVSGYTFIGYRVQANNSTVLVAGESDKSNKTHTGSGTAVSPYTITYKLSDMIPSGGSFTSDYYVYAIYRPNITISASKSYTYNADHGTHSYLTAPPKTITVTRDGVLVATYSFVNGTATTGTLTSKAADYGEGTDIPKSDDSFHVLAGDVIKMTYGMLASSDKIDKVYFNNTTDSTEATIATYISGRSELGGTTINQTDHSVTFTASNATKHITISLGIKHRITFKSKEGFETEKMNIGGYYADGETINFTAERSSGATKIYTIGTPVFYDTKGKIIVSELPSAADMTAAGTTGSDYHVDPAFDLTFTDATDKFTGTMPAYDIVIDMDITTSFLMQFDTKILSDVVGGASNGLDFRYGSGNYAISAANKLTVTKDGASIITAATTSAGPKNTDGTEVIKGSEIVYSADLQSGYTFLGWYRGNEDGPDLEEGLISSSTTFTYIPKANTFVWAIATRDFYIAGNFTYNATTKALTHKANTSDNNNSTKWKNGDEYYRMEYDAVENAYAITFNSIDQKNDSRTSGNPDISSSTSNSAYAKIYLFKCYATKGTGSATGTETYWNNVSNYNNCHLDYPSNTNTNDHMYYGKFKGEGGSGMFEYTKRTTNDGYDVPVTLYFKPSGNSGESKWYIKATRVWPDIYISDGYSNIDSFDGTGSTYYTGVKMDTNNDGTYDLSLSRTVGDYTNYKTISYSGTAVSGAEQAVNLYNFKKENAKIQLSKKVDANHSVPGFVVYDLNDDRVYPVAATPSATVASDYTYTATMTIGLHSLYICPVIYYTGSDALTVNVDASQLNKDEWGDLIGCYPWYATGASTKPNGDFPGQLMYPSDDANTWTGQYKPKDGTYEMTGITFTNYAEGSSISTKTWLGRSVLGSVITTYNDVHRSTNADYNKKNVAVQSFDYREPFAFDKYQVQGKTGDNAAVLSFAFKYGNNDVMKYYHNYLTNDYIAGDSEPDKINIFSGIHHIDSEDVAHTVASGDYKLKRDSFEMLTDATGNYYVDLNGTLLEDQPTPSFYVIAKGQANYLSDALLDVGRSGAATDTPRTAVSYSGVAKMEFGVQWYVYDANGDYITNMLSAGFADQVSDSDSTTLIAKALEDKGYAVDGKGVGISYDYPRYYSGTNIYRFEGQWYATKKTTPVKVTARVGVYTNGMYDLSDSNSESYGTAEVWYDYDEGSPDYEKYVDTDASRSYVKVAIGDASNNPVYLNTSKDNFVGWYYMDQSGKMVKASDKYENFYPEFAGNTTFYAIYEVKANYSFIYLDRYGNKTQYVEDIDLNSAEIKGYAGNGNKPNVPTYIWDTDGPIADAYNAAIGIAHGGAGYVTKNPYATVLAKVQDVVSAYQYDSFTWPTAEAAPSSSAITANSARMSLEITAVCPKMSYTVTYDKRNASGVQTASGSTSVESGLILTFDPNYQFSEAGTYVKVDNFDTSDVTYWSADPSGEKPLTTMKNYGLIITHGGTIYAQTKPLTVSNNWNPMIESLSRTRKKLKSSDTLYLDLNSYFVNTNGEMIRDMATKPHYGVLTAYDKTNGSFVDLPADTARKYIKYFAEHPKLDNFGTITLSNGHTCVLTCFDYNDDAHISSRNRANIMINGSYSFLSTKNLTVYNYVYYGSTKADIVLSSTNFGHGRALDQFAVGDFSDGETAVFE